MFGLRTSSGERRVGAVALAVVWLAGACGASSSPAVVSDRNLDPAVEQTVESATAAPTSVEVATPAPTATAVPPVATSLESVVDQEPNENGDVALSPGTYGARTLPMEFGLTVAEPLTVLAVELGTVALGPADRAPDAFELLVFTEPTRFIDPTAVGGPPGAPGAYVDVPADLGAWLGAVPELNVTATGDGSVGDLPGQWWQIELVTPLDRYGNCGDTYCIVLWESGPDAQWIIAAGVTQRIWQLDSDVGHILAVVESDSALFDGWLPRAETILAGATFGPPTGVSAADLADPRAGQFEMGQSVVSFTDPTRATNGVERGDGTALVAAEAQRSLEVTLAYPAQSRGIDVDPAVGKFPLVLRSHALGGSNAIGNLEEALVSEGFVVAAVRFPESSPPGYEFNHYREQPGDLSFVLDQLLGQGMPAHLLEAVDTDHIGVMGYSLGASTVYGLVGSACCRDDRISAVIAHGGLNLPFEGGAQWNNPPMLLIGGREDGTTTIGSLYDLLPELAGPAYLVDLADEQHLTWTRPDSPAYQGTIDLVRGFFGAHLAGGDPAGVAALAESISGALVEANTADL